MCDDQSKGHVRGSDLGSSVATSFDTSRRIPRKFRQPPSSRQLGKSRGPSVSSTSPLGSPASQGPGSKVEGSFPVLGRTTYCGPSFVVSELVDEGVNVQSMYWPQDSFLPSRIRSLPAMHRAFDTSHLVDLSCPADLLERPSTCGRESRQRKVLSLTMVRNHCLFLILHFESRTQALEPRMGIGIRELRESCWILVDTSNASIFIRNKARVLSTRESLMFGNGKTFGYFVTSI